MLLIPLLCLYVLTPSHAQQTPCTLQRKPVGLNSITCNPPPCVEGSKLTVKCENNFELNQKISSDLRCTNTGSWSIPQSALALHLCTPTTTIATIPTSVGCQVRYDRTGASLKITCLEGTTQKPPDNYDKCPVGSKLTVECETGHTLKPATPGTGVPVAPACVKDDQWEGNVTAFFVYHRCERTTPLPPSKPAPPPPLTRAELEQKKQDLELQISQTTDPAQQLSLFLALNNVKEELRVTDGGRPKFDIVGVSITLFREGRESKWKDVFTEDDKVQIAKHFGVDKTLVKYYGFQFYPQSLRNGGAGRKFATQTDDTQSGTTTPSNVDRAGSWKVWVYVGNVDSKQLAAKPPLPVGGSFPGLQNVGIATKIDPRANVEAGGCLIAFEVYNIDNYSTPIGTFPSGTTITATCNSKEHSVLADGKPSFSITCQAGEWTPLPVPCKAIHSSTTATNTPPTATCKLDQQKTANGDGVFVCVSDGCPDGTPVALNCQPGLTAVVPLHANGKLPQCTRTGTWSYPLIQVICKPGNDSSQQGDDAEIDANINAALSAHANKAAVPPLDLPSTCQLKSGSRVTCQNGGYCDSTNKECICLSAWEGDTCNRKKTWLGSKDLNFRPSGDSQTSLCTSAINEIQKECGTWARSGRFTQTSFSAEMCQKCQTKIESSRTGLLQHCHIVTALNILKFTLMCQSYEKIVGEKTTTLSDKCYTAFWEIMDSGVPIKANGAPHSYRIERLCKQQVCSKFVIRGLEELIVASVHAHTTFHNKDIATALADVKDERAMIKVLGMMCMEDNGKFCYEEYYQHVLSPTALVRSAPYLALADPKATFLKYACGTRCFPKLTAQMSILLTYEWGSNIVGRLLGLKHVPSESTKFADGIPLFLGSTWGTEVEELCLRSLTTQQSSPVTPTVQTADDACLTGAVRSLSVTDITNMDGWSRAENCASVWRFKQTSPIIKTFRDCCAAKLIQAAKRWSHMVCDRTVQCDHLVNYEQKTVEMKLPLRSEVLEQAYRTTPKAELMKELEKDIQEYYGTTKLTVVDISTTVAPTTKKAPKFQVSAIASTASVNVQINQPTVSSSLADTVQLITDITSPTSQPTLSYLSTALRNPASETPLYSPPVLPSSPLPDRVATQPISGPIFGNPVFNGIPSVPGYLVLGAGGGPPSILGYAPATPYSSSSSKDTIATKLGLRFLSFLDFLPFMAVLIPLILIASLGGLLHCIAIPVVLTQRKNAKAREAVRVKERQDRELAALTAGTATEFEMYDEYSDDYSMESSAYSGSS